LMIFLPEKALVISKNYFVCLRRLLALATLRFGCFEFGAMMLLLQPSLRYEI
jgi:hypothetical protein